MANYNRVILVGRLVRDPELKTTSGGKSVAKASLAINERYKANGEWAEKPVFVDVTAWGSTAENLCQYLGKGDPLLAEGRLSMNIWEKDGKKHTKLEVIADKIVFLSKGGKVVESDVGF